MSLLLIGNTVSRHGDVNPTTESAAVFLKRVAEAQFYVPRSQSRSSVAIQKSSKHLNMRWVLNAEIVVVILFLLFFCVRLGNILIVIHIM